MKYLKKFKLNESRFGKKPDNILSIDDIENHFFDLIDNDFEMSEVEISNPWRKIFDNGGYANSEIPKEGFNFFRRSFEFKLKLRNDLDAIKKFNILTENQVIFLNCVKSFVSAEGIVVLDLRIRPSSLSRVEERSEITFEIEFLEELIDDNVDSIDGKIGDFYEKIIGVIRSLSNKPNVRWSFDSIEISLKDDKVLVECPNLTNVQLKRLIENIRDWKDKLKYNVKHNIRRLRNGEINQEDTDFFNRPLRFTYYDFKIENKDKSFLISDIKILDN
jgi:hypothetical protein